MAKRICQSGPNTLLVSDEPAGRGDLLFGEVAVSPSAQFMIECGLQARIAADDGKVPVLCALPDCHGLAISLYPEADAEGCVKVGNTYVSPMAQTMLREALLTPAGTLTADEIECVLLRRRLEQARAEKVIASWGVDHGFKEVWCVFVRPNRDHYPVPFEGATEREALQAAAEYADGLRKPALPEPEERLTMLPMELVRIVVGEIEDGPQRGYVADAVVKIEAGSGEPEQRLSRGQSCVTFDGARSDINEWLLKMGFTHEQIVSAPVLDAAEDVPEQ